MLVDLFNREIIAYSVGRNKTTDLVKQALQSVKGNGCPYDNAVAEATFKIIKTEVIRN